MTLSSCFTLVKQVWDNLKQGLVFTVYLRLSQCPMPVTDMKVKQRKSVILLVLKIPLSITMSMESSRRDLVIDVLVGRFVFKIEKLGSSPGLSSYSKYVYGAS